jgi:TolB-like protein/Tfp pilus assembly protein PilF
MAPLSVTELQRFFGELKRRKVYRVAIAYAAAAFVVIEAADLVLPAFESSDSAYRMIVMLALLGFPIALILAWVFELTPSGLRVTPAHDNDTAPRPIRKRVLFLEISLVIVISAGVLGLSWHLFSSGDPRPEFGDRSLAVLPFESSGPDKSTGFTDGIHDDLLTRLSSVADLSVIARSSVNRYRNADKPITEIASELGVRWILEGRVQQVENQLRVSVRLIDPNPGVQTWADSYLYDLSAANLFAAQSEIAHQIAQALETQLTPLEEREVTRKPTDNLEAYSLFVEARTLLQQREEPQMRQALRLFTQATEIDPDFALAWVGVADSLYELVDYGFQAPDNAVAAALEAANHALMLNPENPEAYVSLGIIHYLQQDGIVALNLLDKAVQLRPGYADAFSKVSWVAQLLGRKDLAIESAERAMELDPLAIEPLVNFAMTRLIEGDAELALSALRQDSELLQDWPTLQFYEGVVLYHMQRYSEAIDLLSGLDIPWAGQGPLATQAVAHARSGQETEARLLIQELKAREAHPFLIALAYASLGDDDEAFNAIESIESWTTDADWPILASRYLYPDVLAGLRSDPRYDRMLRRLDRAWGLVN